MTQAAEKASLNKLQNKQFIYIDVFYVFTFKLFSWTC
jgi:hypothetical protein